MRGLGITFILIGFKPVLTRGVAILAELEF